MKGIFYLFVVSITFLISCSGNEYADPLEEILDNLPVKQKIILANPEKYDIQIRYTQINRDISNIPSFESYEFNVNENRYFIQQVR